MYRGGCLNFGDGHAAMGRTVNCPAAPSKPHKARLHFYLVNANLPVGRFRDEKKSCRWHLPGPLDVAVQSHSPTGSSIHTELRLADRDCLRTASKVGKSTSPRWSSRITSWVLRVGKKYLPPEGKTFVEQASRPFFLLLLPTRCSHH